MAAHTNQSLTAARSITTTGSATARPPEIELLLRCASAAFGSDETESIRELVRGAIDWDSLIGDAEALGVLPILCRTKFPPDAVPAQVAGRMEAYFQSNARRNLFLTTELLAILHLLEENGIPAIPLKGPTLAALAYGDLALRPFSDLDILLRRGDILRATNVLATRRYQLKFSFTPEQLESELTSEHIHHLELLGANRRVLVEMHWDLMQECYFFEPGLNQIWDRRIQRTFLGTTVNSLDPEDLVIFLCVHAWKHQWSRLNWIADLAGLIRSTEIDWPRLFRRANEASSKRRVLLGFGLAKHLLRIPLPPLLQKEIHADRALNKLILLAERTLLSRTDPVSTPLTPYHDALKAGDGLSHRAKILYTFVRKAAQLNENDLAWITLPKPLFFLYYPLRPVRLAARAAARAVRKRGQRRLDI
jgi:Uncharacterised nucleotidyltransferase